MKREIKFRAWNYIHKRMEPVNVLDLYYSTEPRTLWTADDKHRRYDSFDLMQFINSKDRNGVEVYECDILEAPSGKLFIVKWHEEEMRWAMLDKDTWYNMNMALHKVVGNLYENPELLNP